MTNIRKKKPEPQFEICFRGVFPEELSVRAIADVIGALENIVLPEPDGKAVDLGLVEREMDIADRRTINVTLTSEGRIVLEKQRKRIMSAIRETMSCLTDEELEDLSDSLRKLQDILSKLQ